jgi:hypothetical protein
VTIVTVAIHDLGHESRQVALASVTVRTTDTGGR